MLLYKVPILKKRQSSKIRKKVVHNFDFLQRQTKEKLSLILKLENGNMWHKKKRKQKKIWKITDQAKSVLTSTFDFAITFEAGLTFAHKMGG